MTFTSRHQFSLMSASVFLTASLVTCLIIFGMPLSSAHAAEPSEEKPVQSPAVVNHTVAQSTPIDKLVQMLYGSSPLQMSVLRQALVDANPKVITGNPQQRVKAGTTVVVPEHSQIVKKILTPLVAPVAGASSETSDPGPSARDTSVRKPWVRFP
jgi:Tfp pilus assembly protein FimV